MKKKKFKMKKGEWKRGKMSSKNKKIKDVALVYPEMFTEITFIEFPSWLHDFVNALGAI